MFRRDLIAALGLGGALGVLPGRKVKAAVDGPSGSTCGESTLCPAVVGKIDLSQIEIFDTHLHQPAEMTYSQSNEFWNESFVNPLLPSGDFPNRAGMKEDLGRIFKHHLDRLPREIGQRNYVARVYGVAPTNENVDRASAEHIGHDFTGYIRSVYDRENIQKVLLQSDLTNEERPTSLIPDDRFIWSYVINHLLQRDWALSVGAKTIEDVVASIDASLEKCRRNGCAGLKIPIAYYRSLSLGAVDRKLANDSLSRVMKNEPVSYSSISQNEEGEFATFAVHPIFGTSELNQAFTSYQDFLLKHIYVKAGELGLVVIIHSAVALHPALSFEYNNPIGLYHILRDDEIKRAQTKFLLIHGGYPYHDHVASLLSQFPNLYADLSFFANFPGTLEAILRTFLALAPSHKIMYGSDTGLPENTGYCAFNIRQVLAKIMNEYVAHYGWTEQDCESAIRNVLGQNARRVFGVAS